MKTQLNPKGEAGIMGAYSHGLKVDVGDAEMVFVTGQIAQDAQGCVVCDDIEGQTEYVFGCIQKILNEGGSSLDDVVKAQIFLTDINDFAKVSPTRGLSYKEARDDYWHDLKVNEESRNRAKSGLYSSSKDACADYREKNKSFPVEYW